VTLRDLAGLAAGNLWRLKLRSFLTMAGVVIAIAAFVSMLSFGAGNQKLVSEQYDKLGLFFTLQVFPKSYDPAKDSLRPPNLDDAALARISAVPGVRLAYPFDAFSVTVQSTDSQLSTRTQALPSEAVRTRLFSDLVGGQPFANDSAPEVLVSRDLLKRLGLPPGDSSVGQRLILSVRLAVLDSALVNVLRDEDGAVQRRLRAIDFDSLLVPSYLKSTVKRELSAALGRFLDGFMNDRRKVEDTLTICGILPSREHARFRVESMIIPVGTARKLTSGGLSEDPEDMFTALATGRLFNEGEQDSKTYPRATVDLAQDAPYDAVKDSVEALGFRTFSYLEQFKEIQRFFLYFDLALAMIGLIALTTASLGIANTLVMATIERKRDIGVLKSLGAHEGDIKRLFFFEAGAIGLLGSIVGIVFGWAIARAASGLARYFMTREGMEPVELFAIPLWLIGAALAVGLAVSVLAGYYPASRAARVDAADALRGE
jgi:putative ABC transport system permease protein